MFVLEKDMTSIVSESLLEKFGADHSLKEFKTGLGIVDIALGKEFETTYNREIFEDYWELKFVLSHFDRKRKKFLKSSLESLFSFAILNPEDFLARLREHGFIVDHGDYFSVVNTYKPPLKELIMVELKLSDWRSGLHQAIRNKFYSHKSFLAIDIDYLSRVNLQDFVDNKVGLLVVNSEEIEIIYNPPKQQPECILSFSHLANSFYVQVQKDK